MRGLKFDIFFFLLAKRFCVILANLHKKLGEDLKKVKVNRPERLEKNQDNDKYSWQWKKYACRYSDLLAALKGEQWSALGSQLREL